MPCTLLPSLPSAEPLPPNWHEAVDPTYNHPYYYNPTTGERSWVRPKVLPPLAPGWEEAKDPASGVPYYFNAATGWRARMRCVLGFVCVSLCVCVCVRACVHVCVRVRARQAACLITTMLPRISEPRV